MGLSDLKRILVITEKVMWATNSNLLSFWHIQRMKNSVLLNIYRNKLRKPESSQNDCCQLLLSHDKPRGPSSKDTISRWYKNVLKSAGIDVSKFTAHSTRSVSTSFLVNANIKDFMT